MHVHKFCTIPHSVPAPLFYNDDDTPDIFLRVNIGEWDDYEYSYVVIIDGTDGKALWAMNSSYATMQSAVTLMSVNHSQDAVVFFAYNPIDTKSAALKKRQAESDQQGTPSHEEESTPNMGIPPPIDSDQQGTTSHDGEELPPNIGMPPQTDTGYQDATSHDGKEPPEFLKNLNLKHLGEKFWNLSNVSFPDPLADPKGFIESCKYQSAIERQCHLYFITRDLTTGDDIDSIAAAFSAILSEPFSYNV